jgi:hypothetical protein
VEGCGSSQYVKPVLHGMHLFQHEFDLTRFGQREGVVHGISGFQLFVEIINDEFPMIYHVLKPSCLLFQTRFGFPDHFVLGSHLLVRPLLR